jgi:hypothetical protein
MLSLRHNRLTPIDSGVCILLMGLSEIKIGIATTKNGIKLGR